MIGCAVMPSASRIRRHRTHPHQPHLKKINFCDFSSFFQLQLGMPGKHMERESPGSFVRTVAGPPVALSSCKQGLFLCASSLKNWFDQKMFFCCFQVLYPQKCEFWAFSHDSLLQLGHLFNRIIFNEHEQNEIGGKVSLKLNWQ